MNNIKDEVFEYIDELEIIDTHEHLPSFEKDNEQNPDFISEYLTHYFSRDLVSAGLSKEELDLLKIPGSMPISDKWNIIAPYYDDCKYTGYGQAVRLCAKDLYGVEQINRNTIETIDESFRKTVKTQRYQNILKDKCRIKTSILDHLGDDPLYVDEKYFTAAFRIDYIVCPATGNDILRIEEEAGIKITCFDDYLCAVKKIVTDAFEKSCTLKVGLAYLRSLDFKRTKYADAEDSFEKMMDASVNYIDKWEQVYMQAKEFSDYVFRYIMDLCQKRGFAVQIHTGLQEGSGNIIANSNPENLNKLFLDYPDVRFDLFHISYPYQNSAAALAKLFPNVYMDMCWAHIISPPVCVRGLYEWIGSVPINKISGFGGDFIFVDGVYAHVKMAKKNIAVSLAKCVEDMIFDVTEAKRIAKKLLYDNPKNIFDL